MLDIRVWRKKGGQKGLYKLLATNSKTCTIKMPYRPTNFRLIVVKPYYAKDALTIPQDNTLFNITIIVDHPKKENTIIVDQPIKRGRGRPRKYVTFLIIKEKADLDLSFKL